MVPKQQITDLLNQTIDDHNDQFLENTNWDRNTEGQIPSRIPRTMNKPHNNIMKLRERAIMSLSTHKCNMCNGNFRSHFQHELNDCAHPCDKTAEHNYGTALRSITMLLVYS